MNLVFNVLSQNIYAIFLVGQYQKKNICFVYVFHFDVTERFIYYRKSAVLHLLTRMFHVRISADAVQICGKLWDTYGTLQYLGVSYILCLIVRPFFFSLPLFNRSLYWCFVITFGARLVQISVQDFNKYKQASIFHFHYLFSLGAFIGFL